MRVLVFNPSYPPMACGVGAYTRTLAEQLVAHGHDVTVITGEASTTSTEGPPRVLARLREWNVGAFLRAWPRFGRPRPDVVVSSFPAIVEGPFTRLLYLLPGLAKLTLGWPRTVFIVHEFVRTGETERRLLGLALRASDRVVAVTEAERDAIVARYPSVAARTIVRHNAPTTPVAPADPGADARTRAELGPPDRAVIAYVGSLWSEAKGFDELLEALAQTDALLVVTGSLDPGNRYHAQVAAAIDRLALGERVRWLGFLTDDELARVLRAVDAVALPYRGGAQSGYTSMLAALVNGAAVITTRGPENPPWLEDGVTALLIEPADPAALARAISRLVNDDGVTDRLRAGASALRFGWDEIVEAVVAPSRLRE